PHTPPPHTPPPHTPPPHTPPPNTPPPHTPPPHIGCKSVGFSARKAAGADQWHHIHAHTRIRFQETISNFGPHSWDGTKFCPRCPGHYFFSFHAESSEHGDFTLALIKNQRYQVTAYGSKNGWQFAGNSVMLSMDHDDCVWLELQQGEIYEHPHQEAYTTFTGFLIAS
ncbi:unnamed protein product, partial [Meganyctiphanes norvegica]